MIRLDPTKFKRDLKDRGASFFAVDQTTIVTKNLIRALTEESTAAGGISARICLHTMPDADFHEMIVLERGDHYFPPHRHVFKGESCHIIEGELAMFTFDDGGEVQTATVLGRKGSLMSRVGINQWHFTLPLTDPVIYHEAKPGPFLGDKDREFARWAPRANDKKSWRKYCGGLLKQCGFNR
jgi:cupin fold WbuC family metalloprotein